jgi:GT2 family glycosyltransferase
MTVAAVIPNRNGAAHLPAMLDSVLTQTRKFDHITVVDNGSTDGSAQAATDRGIPVIRSAAPLGFAVAVNWGLSAIQAARVAVLNNDLILEPDWLERILESPAGFVCGKLLQAADPSRLDGTFDLITRAGLPWRAGFGSPAALEPDPRPIALASFTAILIRRETLERVGFLDPLFETYLEDTDFCLRCAQAGITGQYLPAAVARHAGSATLGSWSPASTRLLARNQLYLIARHYPTALVRRWWWPIAVGQLLWILVAFRHNVGLPCLRGKWEALRNWRTVRELADSGDGSTIANLIGDSELELERWRNRPGFDSLWRWYFRLT